MIYTEPKTLDQKSGPGTSLDCWSLINLPGPHKAVWYGLVREKDVLVEMRQDVLLSSHIYDSSEKKDDKR